jgi:hypothetical protein
MCSTSRIIKTLITFLCLVAIILFPLKYTDHETRAATKDDILDAYVRIDVEWNNYNPGNSNISQTGSLFVEVRGKIIRSPDRDPFSYNPKNLVANYSYQDRGVDIRPSRGCPELYSEEKGSGVIRILNPDEVKDQTKDGFLRIGLGLQSQGRAPARQKPISKEPEVYTFGLSVPMATTLTKQSTPCSRYQTIPYSAGVTPYFYMDLTKRGMVGSYSWTSNDLERAFHILDYLGQSQFIPQKGAGNVNYRVSWNFGKPKPMVEIWWEGKNVTDKHQNVVVGEKIELKAVVHPEDKDPKRGDWTIPGKFIKDFVVQGEKGEVKDLTKDELKRPEVMFHWWKEGDSLVVKYTTTVDGEKLEAQTTFIVKKPNIPMKAETPDGEFDVVFEKSKSRIELYKVIPGNRPAITFTRDPIKDYPGETEYVQLVNENVRYESLEDSLTPCLTIQKEGLDGEYPYPSEDGGITAKDNPGAAVATSYNLNISVTYDYTMYLLYKPDKKGAIFVPLKKIKWHWRGFATHQRVGDKFDFKNSHVGLDSPEQEANEYPTWKVIVRENDKLNTCTNTKKKKK